MRGLKCFGGLAQREANILSQLPTDGREDCGVAPVLRGPFYAVQGTNCSRTLLAQANL